MDNSSRSRKTGSPPVSKEELDQIVARARQARQERMKGYREQCLRIHPWVCARCGRQFTPKNLYQLTVHHKDHNHDNNPPDGSNWELLCVYCHDHEHGRDLDDTSPDSGIDLEEHAPSITHSPFAGLSDLIKKKSSE
ncbi:MAG TPA: HNH nuclease family protein [Deltaproteobacteria bacterium]|nr:HNH nuclease family protein [Deltaproteobacteria bacterium]